MRCLKTLFVLLGLTLLPTACGTLPGGAPVGRDILRESEEPDANFAIYPVTRAFLPSVAQWPETGAYEVLPWLPYAQGPKTQIIQPGDTLSIQVWDSNENSLLTAPQQRMTQLQGMKVAQDGSIFMPYLGKVSVRNMTPDVAREELQQALETIVPSAQVQLTMEEGRNNSVDLVSGVSNPGSYPMPDRNYTVLGLISAGGGIGLNINNPQIRLVRGNRIYGTSVQKLLNNPQMDTLLRGGDRIFVEEDERYFLSFGATRSENLYTFTKDEMTAMEAISVTGGLQDNAADAKGILILREYPAAAVAPGVRGPRQQRVVFTLDLTTAEGLFSARSFKINPQDLVIATEAQINDAVTVASLVGSFVGVFNSASRIGN